MTARAFLVALACALVPAAPARAVERPAPRSAVTRLLGPAMAAVVRAARRVVSPAPSRARAVLRRSMPQGRRAWPRVRERLWVWWCALLW